MREGIYLITSVEFSSRRIEEEGEAVVSSNSIEKHFLGKLKNGNRPVFRDGISPYNKTTMYWFKVIQKYFNSNTRNI